MKTQMYIRESLLIFSIAWFIAGCMGGSDTKQDKKIMNDVVSLDSLKKLKGISDKAILVDFGGDESDIFTWIDYIGPFIHQGKKYRHIQGFSFFYTDSGTDDTSYYENNEIRNGIQEFNFSSCKIEKSGDVRINLVNSNDSISLFRVLDPDTYQRVLHGVEMHQMATVKTNQYNDLAGDENLEYNLMEEGPGKYVLTLTDGTKVLYELSPDCHQKDSMISYMNRDNGRIYFIDKECYLILKNQSDIQLFNQFIR